jgi:hypothetical protein
MGSHAETRDAALLAARGVGAMLQLAGPVAQPGVESCYVAVDDGAPVPPAALREGLAFVRAAARAGRTVLVACGAGVSRSAAFAAAAVRARHPAAMPHYALLASLCAHFGEAATAAELARAWMGEWDGPAGGGRAR